MITYNTIKISELIEASSVDTDDISVVVQDGETKKITKANDYTSSISADAEQGLTTGTDDKLFVTDTTNADNISSGNLANDRLTDSGVVAGSYTSADLTVNSKGIITSVSSGAVATPDITITYSVNHAYTDANGYADYINKVSDTEISFDVDDGTTYEPLTLTHPSGEQETFTSINNITGIAADGTYTIYRKKSDAANTFVATSNTFSEGYTLPAAGTAGNFHTDISVIPFRQYLDNGATWDLVDVADERTQIGRGVKTGGTLGTPISFALNGRAILSQTATIGNAYTLTHNLGTTKFRVFGFYNNISGVTNLVAGSNGFSIEGGSGSTNQQSAFSNYDLNSIVLRTGSSKLWDITDTVARQFTGADAEIFVVRSF